LFNEIQLSFFILGKTILVKKITTKIRRKKKYMTTKVSIDESNQKEHKRMF
jgi:hypothetical protein